MCMLQLQLIYCRNGTALRLFFIVSNIRHIWALNYRKIPEADTGNVDICSKSVDVWIEKSNGGQGMRPRRIWDVQTLVKVKVCSSLESALDASNWLIQLFKVTNNYYCWVKDSSRIPESDPKCLSSGFNQIW